MSDYQPGITRSPRTGPDSPASPEAARKDDAHKPQMGLIPAGALVEVAKVMTFGARKYSKYNWRENGGLEWSRLYDALQRHLASFSLREDIDAESELPHLAHAACCILMLLEYQRTSNGFDDRFPLKSK